MEAALGKDGVGLADCALAESLFEKGEDVRNQAMKLLAMLEHIRREGTPDMEFAVVGLLARVQIDAGRAQDARESLLDLRERFIRQEQTRFLPNLDAFVCRIDMMQGNDAAVALWYRDKAPRNPQYLQTLKRYQYFTQAMAQLALGDPQGAQVTLAPLEPYCQLCRRHIDGISLNLLRAVAEYRQNSPDWKPRLAAALDAAGSSALCGRPVSMAGRCCPCWNIPPGTPTRLFWRRWCAKPGGRELITPSSSPRRSRWRPLFRDRAPGAAAALRREEQRRDRPGSAHQAAHRQDPCQPCSEKIAGLPPNPGQGRSPAAAFHRPLNAPGGAGSKTSEKSLPLKQQKTAQYSFFFAQLSLSNTLV